MTDYQLRRARSMDVFSRSNYDLRAPPERLSRVHSETNLSALSRSGYYGDYLRSRPYFYGSSIPPSRTGRHYYPTDRIISESYPTYPRNYSAYYNYRLSYPSTYSSFYNYSPISYRRYWFDSYELNSGYLADRYYNIYGGLYSWDRGYSRTYYPYYRPYAYSSSYFNPYYYYY